MKRKDFFELVKDVKKLIATEEGKERLLSNPKKTLKEENFTFPEDMDLEFLQNTKDLHYFVVPLEKIPGELSIKELAEKPTYHEIGLWMIHQIQSNSPLKERLLKEPVKVLDEKKIPHSKNLKIKLFCNTENKIYFVLPKANGGELSEKQLKAVAGGSGAFGGSGGFFSSGHGMFDTGGQHMGSQNTSQTSKGGSTDLGFSYSDI